VSGGYRGQMNAGPPASQQNYGNNYSGGNAVHVPPQQPYYGQPQMPPQQPQIYHQPISNNYQQMGQIPRSMNTSQPVDTRGYNQPPQVQNRS
jgi:hypothetical protein